MKIASGSRVRSTRRGRAAAFVFAALTMACPWRPAVLHAAPTPAASATPAANAPLDATNLDGLRAHLNEQVTVVGTPLNTGHSKAGNAVYLDFGRAHQALSLVFFVKGSGGQGSVAGEEDLKPFVGKPVAVTGKLTDYKGDLQIKIETLDQIKAVP